MSPSVILLAPIPVSILGIAAAVVALVNEYPDRSMFVREKQLLNIDVKFVPELVSSSGIAVRAVARSNICSKLVIPELLVAEK